MKSSGLTLIVILVALSVTSAVAQSEEPTQQKGTFAVGGGFSGSTTETDVPRDGSERFVSHGWGLVFRAGLSKRWGIALSYRDTEDRENYSSGEAIETQLVGGHAYFTWLETKHSHWYAKAGLTWADFRSSIPGGGSNSDAALGPSIGLGVDWGTRRVAFFFDWDVTLVDVELIPGREESFITGATIIGVITKF
jgi:hypothetical protein